MATRTVTGTIRRTEGDDGWASAEVHFDLVKGSYTATAQYPRDRYTATTNGSGVFTADLWTEDDGLITTKYLCTLPSGETFKFHLPLGDGTPINISTLRAAYTTPVPAPDALTTMVETEVADQLEVVLDDHEAAANPHPIYLTAAEGNALYAPLGSGVTDHGALTGLADDDHGQYLNNARGDARYWPLSTDLATQAELDTEASTRASADTTNATAISTHTARTDNPHSVTAAQVGAYSTAQADTLLAAKAGTFPNKAWVDSVSGNNTTAILAARTSPMPR